MMKTPTIKKNDKDKKKLREKTTPPTAINGKTERKKNHLLMVGLKKQEEATINCRIEESSSSNH